MKVREGTKQVKYWKNVISNVREGREKAKVKSRFPRWQCVKIKEARFQMTTMTGSTER